ncbi:MAG: type IV pilin [Euryarchaeota archaeon]|nr:type IV pilin [Euryarchaeota archaeon]
MSKPRIDRRAVSSVIATILMVSVTIVLSGILVYYMTSVPDLPGEIKYPLGVEIKKNQDANWVLFIVNGQTLNLDIVLNVKNSATSATTLNSPLNQSSPYFYYNKLNPGGPYLDTGDTILLNRTAGIIEVGFQVQLLKRATTLTGPFELP